MLHIFDCLRQMNTISVLFRLCLAMVCGGIIGLERTKKGRAAGFRTYMLVCLGATLSILLSQYEYMMLQGPWSAVSKEVGVSTDMARFGAQVINGIGFLGAGTIIVLGKKEVKGLTTAAGLWSSACLGLAIGAGFYECIIYGVPLVFICIRYLPRVDNFVMEHSRHMDIYIEFTSLNDLSEIITVIKQFNIQIVDWEIEKKNKRVSLYPSAVFSLILNEKMPHSDILAAIGDINHVRIIDEL
jgi:putative Mg2+ transporter-C (MgtC) family protein